jgi:hypothetical protein
MSAVAASLPSRLASFARVALGHMFLRAGRALGADSAALDMAEASLAAEQTAPVEAQLAAAPGSPLADAGSRLIMPGAGVRRLFALARRPEAASPDGFAATAERLAKALDADQDGIFSYFQNMPRHLGEPATNAPHSKNNLLRRSSLSGFVIEQGLRQQLPDGHPLRLEAADWASLDSDANALTAAREGLANALTDFSSEVGAQARAMLAQGVFPAAIVAGARLAMEAGVAGEWIDSATLAKAMPFVEAAEIREHANAGASANAARAAASAPRQGRRL